MKFIKKYGIYITLLAVTVVLGSAGYISENGKEKAKITEKVSVPEVKEVPSEEVSAAVKSEEAPAKEEKTAEVPQKKKYIYPVTGEPFVAYSENEFIYSRTMNDFRVHRGLDFMCNEGEKIVAAGDGIISDVYEDSFLGVCVEIGHNDGIKTRYCSLSGVTVSVGDKVETGQEIAVAGNTSGVESAEGIHLHFEVLKDGKQVNPDIIFLQK